MASLAHGVAVIVALILLLGRGGLIPTASPAATKLRSAYAQPLETSALLSVFPRGVSTADVMMAARSATAPGVLDRKVQKPQAPSATRNPEAPKKLGYFRARD